MRFAFLRSVVLFAGCAAYVGCSGANFEVPEPDTGAVDDVGAKDSTNDTATSDGGTVDSTTDTGNADTGKVDTGLIDTGLVDTGLIDTGLVDTGLIDTGVLPDAPGDGAVCPRPNSTATYDPGALDCPSTQTKFVANLEEARSCLCDADCSVTIKNLCGCDVWVSPANDAYVAASRLKARWDSLTCPINCPAIPCMISSGKVCVKYGGIMGKCQ
jgi:hypothetical protein